MMYANGQKDMCGLQPERLQQISPGQSVAATAAKRRPGCAGLVSSALLRATQSLLIPFVSPLTGLEIATHADPGRRFAANAASLCPGLICDGLSGRKTILFREDETLTNGKPKP